MKPLEIQTVVGMLAFQLEFFSGREFGLRVRGEGLVLLNRTRELLQAIHEAEVAVASGKVKEAKPPAPRPGPLPLPLPRKR